MKKIIILAGVAGLAYVAYTQGWLASLGLSVSTPATPPPGVGALNNPAARTVGVGAIDLGGPVYAGPNPAITSVA